MNDKDRIPSWFKKQRARVLRLFGASSFSLEEKLELAVALSDNPYETAKSIQLVEELIGQGANPDAQASGKGKIVDLAIGKNDMVALFLIAQGAEPTNLGMARLAQLAYDEYKCDEYLDDIEWEWKDVAHELQSRYPNHAGWLQIVDFGSARMRVMGCIEKVLHGFMERFPHEMVAQDVDKQPLPRRQSKLDQMLLWVSGGHNGVDGERIGGDEQTRLARRLLENGARVKSRDFSYDKCALTRALAGDNPQMVQLLIEYGQVPEWKHFKAVLSRVFTLANNDAIEENVAAWSPTLFLDVMARHLPTDFDLDTPIPLHEENFWGDTEGPKDVPLSIVLGAKHLGHAKSRIQREQLDGQTQEIQAPRRPGRRL